MKDILVTGGNGFIGTNLVKCLLKEGDCHIYILDNQFSTKKDVFRDNPRVTIIRDDVTIFTKSNYWRDKSIDEIYHLACPASPPFYWKNPIHTLDTCYLGTKNVLDLALKTRARVVFTSTSEIYGDAQVSPQPETYFGNVNSFGERSCYDEGKRVAETLCYEYQKKGVDVRIARIFNTYGPYMDLNDGRIVTEVIRCLIEDKPLTVYGDGNQTRSFCFVDDTVRGLIRLMEITPLDEEKYSPINIGNPEEHSINYMIAETIREFNKLNSSVKDLAIHKVQKRSDDPMVRKPNIDKANTLLCWKPTIDFNEGIRRTIEYFRGKHD